MKTIPLANGRGFARIDDGDYELVSRYKWRIYVAPKTSYAHANIGTGRARKDVRMHVLITGKRGLDHIDGDGLNNQRSNLREATSAQQKMNRRKSDGKSSRYKGVSWNASRGRWYAHITGANRPRHIGVFTDEAEAARAYDAAAREAFGAFARLNFPDC
jgi:hypothetical protein